MGLTAGDMLIFGHTLTVEAVAQKLSALVSK